MWFSVSKMVSLIGPMKSGKTSFLYLMRLKLIEQLLSGKGLGRKGRFKNFSGEGFDDEVESKIKVLGLPPPGTLKDDQRDIYLNFWNSKFDYQRIYIPDQSGHLLEKLGDEAYDEGELLENVQILREMDAIIILFDAERLESDDRTGLLFYDRLYHFLQNFRSPSSEVLNIQALFMISKAEKLDTNPYGQPEIAKSLLNEKMKLVFLSIYSLFPKNNVSFALHSPSGRTIERDGVACPDIGFFEKKLCAEEYTKAFLDFVLD